MDSAPIPNLLTNPASVVEAATKLTHDRIGCRECIEALGGRSMVPSHSRMHLMVAKNGDVAMLNSGCSSNSLRYNPRTKELFGRRHCTCDSCF